MNRIHAIKKKRMPLGDLTCTEHGDDENGGVDMLGVQHTDREQNAARWRWPRLVRLELHDVHGGDPGVC
jgi:hypothetical protein